MLLSNAEAIHTAGFFQPRQPSQYGDYAVYYDLYPAAVMQGVAQFAVAANSAPQSVAMASSASFEFQETSLLKNRK